MNINNEYLTEENIRLALKLLFSVMLQTTTIYGGTVRRIFFIMGQFDVVLLFLNFTEQTIFFQQKYHDTDLPFTTVHFLQYYLIQKFSVTVKAEKKSYHRKSRFTRITHCRQYTLCKITIAAKQCFQTSFILMTPSFCFFFSS